MEGGVAGSMPLEGGPPPWTVKWQPLLGWMRKLEGLSTNSYLSFFEAYLCGVNVLIFLAPIRCNLSTLCCQHNHSGKQMLGAMVYKSGKKNKSATTFP